MCSSCHITLHKSSYIFISCRLNANSELSHTYLQNTVTETFLFSKTEPSSVRNTIDFRPVAKLFVFVCVCVRVCVAEEGRRGPLHLKQKNLSLKNHRQLIYVMDAVH